MSSALAQTWKIVLSDSEWRSRIFFILNDFYLVENSSRLHECRLENHVVSEKKSWFYSYNMLKCCNLFIFVTFISMRRGRFTIINACTCLGHFSQWSIDGAGGGGPWNMSFEHIRTGNTAHGHRLGSYFSSSILSLFQFMRGWGEQLCWNIGWVLASAYSYLIQQKFIKIGNLVF